MFHAALDHSIPRAGAWQGMHPIFGPCLSELASDHKGPKLRATPASATLTHAGQSKKEASAFFLFKNPFPGSHVLWKPVGKATFSTNEGHCQPYLPVPLFWVTCLAMGQSWPHRCTSSLLLSHELLICHRQSPSSGNLSLHRKHKLILISNFTLGFSPCPLPSLGDWAWPFCYRRTLEIQYFCDFESLFT